MLGQISKPVERKGVSGHGPRRMTAVVMLALSGFAAALLAAESPRTLVRVNGQPVTEADLKLDFHLRQLPQEVSESEKRRLLETLVDRRLIAAFLKQRKVDVPAEEVDRRLELVKKVIEQGGGTYEDVLARIGLNESQMRDSLALPLAWNIHVQRTVTNAQVIEYFQAHRRELDGTKLAGAQIVKTLSEGANDEEWDAAKQKLQRVREEIGAGKVTFADAARMHSDSPSGEKGGDLGRFEYTGRLPVEITSVAFKLKPGELSDVFRTRFGVHLLQVTEEIPGQLSAEDVRPQIVEELSRQMWDSQVKQERAKARIQWLEQTGTSP
jgi:peptidyl-prolyl cis-trans isomerase C